MHIYINHSFHYVTTGSKYNHLVEALFFLRVSCRNNAKAFSANTLRITGQEDWSKSLG